MAAPRWLIWDCLTKMKAKRQKTLTFWNEWYSLFVGWNLEQLCRHFPFKALLFTKSPQSLHNRPLNPSTERKSFTLLSLWISLEDVMKPTFQCELLMYCDVLTNIKVLDYLGLKYCGVFSEPGQQKGTSTQAGQGAEVSRLRRCWFSEWPEKTKCWRM